jgi:adenosylcobyric acid synthase
MGQTVVNGGETLLRIKARNRDRVEDVDGCQVAGGRIAGTYLHGLFDSPEITRRWLACWGLEGVGAGALEGPAARDQAYDLLADHVAQYVDLEAVTGLIGTAGN